MAGEGFLDIAAVPLVAGRHEADGWKVRMAVVPGVVVTLEPGQARELARELVQMADVIEGEHAAFEDGSASLRSATAGAPPQGGWGYSE